MPKENIHCSVNRGEDPNEAWRIEVRWSPQTNDQNGLVQVGAVNPKSPFQWSMVNVDDTEGQFCGYFTTPDREGCNRLIRALRRARDAAYGADA